MHGFCHAYGALVCITQSLFLLPSAHTLGRCRCVCGVALPLHCDSEQHCLIFLVPGTQSHGRRTKYAVMLDADMRISAAWRLRVTLQRVAQLCAASDQDPLCFQAFRVPVILDDIKFFSIRVFPTTGAGTLDGWHYTYPVHEVGTCPRCTQRKATREYLLAGHCNVPPSQFTQWRSVL